MTIGVCDSSTLPIGDLDLCTCCAILAANGDTSGCRDYHGHPEHALRLVADLGPVAVAHVTEDGDGFHVGACDGCGVSGPIVASGSVVS